MWLLGLFSTVRPSQQGDIFLFGRKYSGFCIKRANWDVRDDKGSTGTKPCGKVHGMSAIRTIALIFIIGPFEAMLFAPFWSDIFGGLG